MNLEGVKFGKLFYAYKHYILFSCLTNNKIILKSIPRTMDKIWIAILWLPGIILTKLVF